MSLYDIAKTQIEFEQALKVGKIELVDLRNAPPLLLKEIAKNSALLYERDVFAFSRFKIYAFKRYMESKNFLLCARPPLTDLLKT